MKSCDKSPKVWCASSRTGPRLGRDARPPQVDELKDRPIHDYVSVLAERAVKKQLKHG